MHICKICCEWIWEGVCPSFKLKLTLGHLMDIHPDLIVVPIHQPEPQARDSSRCAIPRPHLSLAGHQTPTSYPRAVQKSK